MIRLLVVTRENEQDKRYGLGKSLMPVLAALARHGVEWQYLCRSDAGERGWAWARRVHRWLVPPLQWVFRGTDVTALLWGFLERVNMGRLGARVALRDGFTHVHCHDPLIALGLRWGLFGRRRGKGVRWGITEHGFGSYTQALHEDGARLGGHMMRWLRGLERRIVLRADWLVAPTGAALQQLGRDLGVPARPANWHVVPHALPTLPQIDRDEARRRLGWPRSARVVLAVGRLVPLKRFDLLLEAFARIEDATARLVILGEGDAGALTRQAGRLSVAGRVDIHSTDDIWPYYAGADAYVSASSTESFGMANLEAVAMGTPSVCTAAGGVPEVVGRAAMLVPVDDVAAMASMLDKVLGNPLLRAQMSNDGRALAAAHPDADRVAQAYWRIYRDLATASGTTVVSDPISSQGSMQPIPSPPSVADHVFNALPVLPLPEGLSVLVLAPHADDETLGCGGTVARLAGQGASVTVAVISDGRKGDPLGYCAGEVVQARKQEALSASRVLGVAETVFLDFPDGELRCDERLCDALREVVERSQPDWVFMPASNDAHRDHVEVARAFEVVRATSVQARHARCFEYETWTPVEANYLVDLGDGYARKAEALAMYALPLRYVDYLAAAEGLARYRAMQLPTGGGHAEAFRERFPGVPA